MNAPHLKLAPTLETGRAQVRANMLEAQLAASLELLAAIERIRIVPCHDLPHGTLDVCGDPLDTRCCMADRFEGHGRDCVLVYALEVGGSVLYARTVEDAACELLLHCDPEQRQDRATVARTVDMITDSFARARAAAKERG